jgi:hypothetical protein
MSFNGFFQSEIYENVRKLELEKFRDESKSFCFVGWKSGSAGEAREQL